jgi:hypothetical protein
MPVAIFTFFLISVISITFLAVVLLVVILFFFTTS